MCDYVQNHELKILFLRESEGVYRFGQKRVYIKVEKGNKIVVKVGGGFMQIEDFIKLYTTEEVEKIKRNDVYARFQNKLQAQRIACMSSESKEMSPISSPQRPDKNKRVKTDHSMYIVTSPSSMKQVWSDHKENNENQPLS